MYKKGVFISHPDIELGFERKPVEYYITFPEQGMNQETGLIFSICAHGETADSKYMLNKLNPYMANKANCLVAGLNYHGIDRNCTVRFDDPGWLTLAEQLYGYKDNRPKTNIMIRLRDFFLWAEKKGIPRLDTQFQKFFYADFPEYYSAGFLPALDHLAVLKEIMRDYQINPCRIVAFGSSYGGYIAHLIAKFAPDTLALVIDNSGFSRASFNEMLNKELIIGGRVGVSGKVEFPWAFNQPWTILDEKSPYYFSDSCRSIRSLLEEEHYTMGETEYHIFHCTNDYLVAPIDDKDKVVEYLRKKAHLVHYTRVTEQDIDGNVFKKFEHAMDASLKGIFDLVMAEEGNNFSKSSNQNDFTNNAIRVFDCGAKHYIFSYHDDYSMEVKIEDTITYIKGK